MGKTPHQPKEAALKARSKEFREETENEMRRNYMGRKQKETIREAEQGLNLTEQELFVSSGAL